MKNLIIFSLVLFFSFSCKAQDVIASLKQMEECSNRPGRDTLGCPDLENVTYVKDIDNRLDQFVGTWKGAYNGKTYEFRFVKKLKFGENTVKRDRIIGRLIVKNSNGVIIYNDTNLTDTNVNLFGSNFQNRTYEMYFSGNVDYCNSGGTVWVELKKDNPTIMFIDFSRDQEMIDTRLCPNYATFEPLLPLHLELTKQ